MGLAVVALATVALWPASEESTAEVEDALAEVDEAVTDSLDHGGDALGEHVSAQEDALVRAAGGFVGTLTSESDFDSELYQVELDYAVEDLTSQAEDFRTEAPEVEQAYWDGFEDGFSDE